MDCQIKTASPVPRTEMLLTVIYFNSLSTRIFIISFGSIFCFETFCPAQIDFDFP